MAKRLNPDDVIEALEKFCERFEVSIYVRAFTRDVVIYDREGMEVCSFNKLSGNDGPSNLEIGGEYQASYSIGLAKSPSS